MILIPDKVNAAKVRKKNRLPLWDAKIGAHTTINGLGKVSGLVRKHNRKRKG